MGKRGLVEGKWRQLYLKNNLKKEKREKTNGSLKKNNMLLTMNGLTMRSRKKIKRYIDSNGNENTMRQNLWDTGKAVLRRRFIA